ncbi:protein DMP3 [Malania oleifera]|uniref:protein DMP3-like n=1 Tax=Malania oleifera TaxID=397392 RepID=UPI0025AE7490|nr:protein DMP3-like [Malania oleifera]XP_057978430.1 protein DMP3 [Malania oleifera]
MSSLRTRPSKSAVDPTAATTASTVADQDGQEALNSPPPPPTPAPTAISKILGSTANLANLLPTGTLLAFQFLTPVFTNNGSCDGATGSLTVALLVLLAASCFLACFTDSVKTDDGRVYHGLATLDGMWLFDYDNSGELPDLRKHRVRLIDGVHGVLTVLVFLAVALRDKNVVGCFYPKPGHEAQEVLDIVPIGIGVICSLLFVVFPTTRIGIGYSLTPAK